MATPQITYNTIGTITYTETTAITDLTGTKWILNASLTIEYEGFTNNSVIINFKSNQTINYQQIEFDYADYRVYYYKKSGMASTRTLIYNDGSWTSQNYRTLEIQGGTDATNSTLIRWIRENATQVEVTDLSGTEWEFTEETLGNYQTPTISGKSFGINAKISGTDYNSFYINNSGSVVFQEVWFSNGNADYYLINSGSVFTGNLPCSVSITSGTDATNPDLIAWLTNNATYQTPVQPSSSGMYLGGSDVSLYLGSANVSKVYLGTVLLYEGQAEIIPDNAILTADNKYLVDSTGGYLLTTEIALISFTIAGTTYQAESGMTWAEWVASAYNTDGYYSQYGAIWERNGEYVVAPNLISSSSVIPTDTITANEAYDFTTSGAGN